jgi:hypothetical protein
VQEVPTGSATVGLGAARLGGFNGKGWMKRSSYKGHTIELASDQVGSGAWVARATVRVHDRGSTKNIPIFGRRRASFDSRREADAYALELAKLWIEGRLWGANGH